MFSGILNNKEIPKISCTAQFASIGLSLSGNKYYKNGITDQT